MDRKVIALGLLASALFGAAALAMWLAEREGAASQGAASAPSTRSTTNQSGEGAPVTLSYPALLATQVRDMHGTPQSIGQWQGKLLVINFWATWCGPCKEEMPYFDEIFREYSAKGLQVIGIAADPPEKVSQFLNQVKVSYPLFPDQEGALAFSRRAGNRIGVLPHTLIYSSSGELILNKLGQLSKEDLALIVRENLQKSGEKSGK